MQIIRTLDELDEKICECDRASEVSDDELRAVFNTFRMDPDSKLPTDPFSSGYHDFQMGLYRDLAGKDYSTANETTNFDVAAAVRRPFPYSTGSCGTTGEHLIAIGAVLRIMALPPQSRVLELGPGWGNITIALARLGHVVTAVDIEPRFCELIKLRAAREDLAIEVVNADFMSVASMREPFDAVLFFESFHHAVDHLALLRSLRKTVTAEGRLFFAGEPIQPDFPYPWGLRLDGQSLWSIRKHGWLELGFNDRYFLDALARTGWFGQKHVSADLGWLNVWEARRRDNTVFRFTAGNSRLSTQVGSCVGQFIQLSNAPAGTALYGPYVTLPPGRYIARLCFRPGVRQCGRAIMDASTGAGARSLATRVIDVSLLPPEDRVVELEVDSSEELKEMELRLFCEGGFTAQIEAVEFRPAGYNPPADNTSIDPIAHGRPAEPSQ